MAFSNITGTSEVHFRITLGGPTVYQGSADPSVSPPPVSLDGLAFNAGDLYIRTGASSPGLYTLGTTGGTDWNKFLVAGGPIIVGGNLSVGGTIDQSGPIIILNSGGPAIPGTGAGIEIDRSMIAPENVRWVWDDVNGRWAATNDGPNPLINNVYVENNLQVDGDVRVPTGLAATPAIFFGPASPRIGLFSTGGALRFSTFGTERWNIDTDGHFAPFADNVYDIGATLSVPRNVYGTVHLAAFGSAPAPSYVFNTETTTGLYRPSAGAVGIAGGGVEIARFDTTTQQVTINNVAGVDSFVINGSGSVFLRINAPDVGNTAGIEFRGSGGAPDNWQIGLDQAQSSRLDFAYGGTDLLNIQTNGRIQASDGTAALPVYSFISDPTAGIFSDGAGGVSIATTGNEAFRVNTDGSIEATTAAYELLVTVDSNIPNKKYVDDLFSGASSWREPANVKEDTAYANIAAAEVAMNLGTVDGVVVGTGERILYTAITGSSTNVYIVTGTVGAGATLVQDSNLADTGDVIYISRGTFANKVFAYDAGGVWTEISGAGGGGGTLFFTYEVQTAPGAQVAFALANAYSPTPTGVRLLVYVNGIKQEGNGAAYSEVDANNILFTVAPTAGKRVEFYAVGAATQNGILNRETRTGIIGTQVINFTGITYVVGQDGLLVYLNGQKMIVDTDYTETSSTSITWLNPSLIAADVLEFYSSIPIVAGTNLEDVDNVDGTPPVVGNDGDVLTWVDANGQWEPQVIPSSAGMNIDELKDGVTNGGLDGPITFTTVNVIPTAAVGGVAFLQVFMNGVLQKEAVSWFVSSATTIDFIAAVPAGAEVTIYQL